MGWFQQVTNIDPFDEAPLDAALIAAFERDAAEAPVPARAVRFYTPTFKSFETSEL